MKTDKPIGVFDSGLGGVLVARTILEALPGEDVLYYADSAYAPYGNKTVEHIIDRCDKIVDFLISRDAKAIVVACNTATVAAIQTLRSKYTLPIVGMVPGIKPASVYSKIGAVGILATSQTINSTSFKSLAQDASRHIKIYAQACPGLVERVEALDFDGPKTIELLKSYILPLLAEGIDTLVVGCTHYLYLEETIRKIVGNDIEIVTTNLAVASQLNARLLHFGIRSARTGSGNFSYFTSGCIESRAKLEFIIQRFNI